jgi:hypothetical protein
MPPGLRCGVRIGAAFVGSSPNSARRGSRSRLALGPSVSGSMRPAEMPRAAPKSRRATLLFVIAALGAAALQMPC